MVSPRRTRLVRVSTLREFRRAIASGCAPDRPGAGPTAVLVPSRSAAIELRRTLEATWRGAWPAGAALELLTRDEWYARMHASLADPPRLLSSLQREVIMHAAAREAVAAGVEPPFTLRAGLVVEMRAFYDELRRRDQSVERFEALLAEKLEPSVEDRGAARMLQQTRFLASAFRAYARRVGEAGAADEHALRERLLADAGERPLRRLMVTVGDRACEPPGLWIADFDLMARMPAIDEIDIIATGATLNAGWHERLHAAMPGIEEVDGRDDDAWSCFDRLGTNGAGSRGAAGETDLDDIGSNGGGFPGVRGEESIRAAGGESLRAESAVRPELVEGRTPRAGPFAGDRPGDGPLNASNREDLADGVAAARAPVLRAPPRDADRLFFLVRDREEELARIARRLKAERRLDPATFALDRHAIVFKRPLPYLYLAPTVFDAAGIPYQASDAVPLAGEPFAAAVDVAIEAVTSGFTRASLVALLRSPHFLLGDERTRVPLASVRAFDRRLSEAGYLGDPDALARIVADTPDSSAAAGAARAALRVTERLRLLSSAAPASAHLQRFRDFLVTCERTIEAPGERSDATDALEALEALEATEAIEAIEANEATDATDAADPLAERHLRARGALVEAMTDLEAAHREQDDPETTFAEVAARLRRWIEGETFRPRTGAGGVHLVDAGAAIYGAYDHVHLVGLIERDWPEPARGQVFYSTRLLSALGWPSESDRAAAPRAAFRDLLALPARTISVSAMTLEDEALVDASPFLDELGASRLAVVHEIEDRTRVFADEALASEPLRADVVAGAAAEWLALRTARAQVDAARFQGRASAHAPGEVSVSAVERYLECPFKYFAVHVLGLDEDPEDEDVMSPRARGLFIHEVFQAFFEAWGSRGAITPERLDEARALFAGIVERALATLGPAEAALERTRLLGSPVAAGLGEAVFRMEAERPAPVIERLLEFPVRGAFELEHDDARLPIRVRGVADRIDLLADRTFRILDYKSGRAPQPRRALQLPLYSACAARQLTARDATPWTVSEAAYIAFGGPRRIVPMASRGSDDQAMLDAQGRLADAVASMRRGEFLVQPLEPFRCTFCAYAGVCRKDYVGDE